MPSPLEETVAASEYRHAVMQARVLGIAGKYDAAHMRAREALAKAE